MRIAVTGATGNVGTSLLDALERDPQVESVVGVARRQPGPEASGRWAKATWVEADVAEGDGLTEAFRGADAVVHLAWLIQPSHRVDVLWKANVVGSRRVLEAVAAAGVPALVHASSVGAYSPGPKEPVDESWPTDGIATSPYSWQKAYVERLLDVFERDWPEVRVVRLRPGLMLKGEAATGVRRLFLGPLLPNRVLPQQLATAIRKAPARFQVLHADDGGEAFHLACVRDVRGPFNLAAEPVLGSQDRNRPFLAAARGAARAAWALHLQPADPGWVDLVQHTPLLDTTRARTELGWMPAHTADEAVDDLVAGLRGGDTAETPPLAAETSGPARSHELATGIGQRP
ncbi:MAG TPA: NAD-dependent epimerase/dehydratase family protein [Acidimicrobiales bacterium]|jgi:nucleoside-diphosphate-sugar epimerase